MSTPTREALRRIAGAVVAAELRRLRGAGVPLPPDREETTPIGDDGLGLDSLERIGALGALAEYFGLDEATLGDRPPRTVGDWIDWIMRGQRPGAARITVDTSGSTGPARPCPHALPDLIDEARFFAAQLTGRRRVLTLVPAHHLYGLIWTALLPDVLGVPVVPRAVGAALAIEPGDLIVAVPDQWHAIRALTRRFPPDVVGVSSAAPLDDGVAADLLAAGLSRLLDIYGSSETGGIALRDLPAPHYTLLPRWRLARHGDDWRLADARGGHHALPDHVVRIGERGLRPTGRRDRAVQVGGCNVSPGRVADVLRGIDGVADCAVRLHAGGRLKAFIVPDPSHDPADLAVAVERTAGAALPVAERPRHLRFGPALPRNAMGKLQDWD